MARRHKFWRDTGGVALVEFAVWMSVLSLLLLASVDLGRLLIVSQKLDRLASGLGDLVAQAQQVTQADLNNIFAATPHIATPFDFVNKGIVVVSSVSLVNGAPRINWQSKGGGTLTAVSKLGTSGGTATLPPGMTISGQDTLIVAEVYFDFESLFSLTVVPDRQLYHRSFFRPRLGSLKTIGG